MQTAWKKTRYVGWVVAYQNGDKPVDSSVIKLTFLLVLQRQLPQTRIERIVSPCQQSQEISGRQYWSGSIWNKALQNKWFVQGSSQQGLASELRTLYHNHCTVSATCAWIITPCMIQPLTWTRDSFGKHGKLIILVLLTNLKAKNVF